MNENIALAKKLNKIAIVITIAVLLLVGAMRRYKIPTDIDFSFLPGINAALNSIVSVLLLVALVFIKRNNIEAHRKTIYAALVFSALFLLTYVLYHFTTEETRYCGEGMIKKVYYFFLITHIVLAGVSFPFILFTFIRAYTNQIEKHKKMARYVWPVWFYVAISGPIVYFMLKPCYG